MSNSSFRNPFQRLSRSTKKSFWANKYSSVWPKPSGTEVIWLLGKLISNKTSRAYYRDEEAFSALNKSILIKNMVGKLASLNEKDIKRLFAPFGEVVATKVQNDPRTGQNLGYAIVQYSKVQDANTAIQKMNGFVVSGEPLIVAQLPSYLSEGLKRISEHDDEDINRKNRHNDISQSVIVTQVGGTEKQISAVEKLINPEVAEIQRKIRTSQYYSKDPTKVLGIFNLYESAQKDPKQEIDFFHYLKSDVKSDLISGVQKVRRDSKSKIGQAKYARSLRQIQSCFGDQGRFQGIKLEAV